MNNNTDNSTEKKRAAKGPIRTEAVVPISIIILVTFLYFYFAFDSHLRKAIEWGGSYVHGAEVNVGQLNTSFVNGSFSLKQLEVTDKEVPTRNLIKIGEIKFHFLWDALLRAKFVVADAGINGIEIYSPRKRPGHVTPQNAAADSTIAKNEKKILSQTKSNSEDESGGLDKISDMIDGAGNSDIAKDIQADLKSEARIKELTIELKTKENAWKERLDKLPQKAEFSALVARAKALKFNTKNPKDFAADLKELSHIKNEADKKISTFKTMSKDLKEDVEKYNAAFKNIDDLVKQDIKDLESKLKLPNLESGDLSNSIYGKMFGSKLAAAQKYMLLARKYMPPPKDPKKVQEDDLLPRARASGKNFKFKVTTGYPLFWLKKSSISSEPTSEGFAGKVSGHLTNVTSDPTFVGKPAVLDVSGDFPRSDIQNATLKITIDHVSEPKESIALSVGHFPLLNQSLIRSGSVSLGVKKAAASSNFFAQLYDSSVNVELKSEFKNLDYDLNAKSKTVSAALTRILADIPVITLNAAANGTWDDLDLHLNSNLGSELSQGLKKYVQARIDEIKQKIQNTIDSKIKPQREKLTADFNKIKGLTDNSLKSKTDELNKARDEVQGAKASGKSGDAKQQLKEKGLKLLKGFKF